MKTFDIPVSFYVEAKTEEEAFKQVSEWLDRLHVTKADYPKGTIGTLIKLSPQAPKIDQTFQSVVRGYLDSGHDLNVLADEFEAAPATVERWANGLAVPIGGMRAEIIKWIDQKMSR